MFLVVGFRISQQFGNVGLLRVILFVCGQPLFGVRLAVFQIGFLGFNFGNDGFVRFGNLYFGILLLGQRLFVCGFGVRNLIGINLACFLGLCLFGFDASGDGS